MEITEALEIVHKLATENALEPKEADTIELYAKASRQDEALLMVRGFIDSYSA